MCLIRSKPSPALWSCRTTPLMGLPFFTTARFPSRAALERHRSNSAWGFAYASNPDAREAFCREAPVPARAARQVRDRGGPWASALACPPCYHVACGYASYFLRAGHDDERLLRCGRARPDVARRVGDAERAR